MRPRDLTKRNWHQYPNALNLRSGLEVTIGWATGTIDFTISSTAGQISLIVPRRSFDKMVDWYLATCDEKFWRETTDGGTAYFGKSRIQRGCKIREWQISANRLRWTEGKNSDVCDVPRVDRTVLIRGEGPEDQIGVMFVRREDFDRIVNWYNSEYKQERRAA